MTNAFHGSATLAGAIAHSAAGERVAENLAVYAHEQEQRELKSKAVALVEELTFLYTYKKSGQTPPPPHDKKTIEGTISHVSAEVLIAAYKNPSIQNCEPLKTSVAAQITKLGADLPEIKAPTLVGYPAAAAAAPDVVQQNRS